MVKLLVRAAAAWALGQIGGPAAATALTARRNHETDATVLAELDAAQADASRQ